MRKCQKNLLRAKFWPKFWSPIFFFVGFILLDVRHCCKLALYAISRKTNNRKWRKNLVLVLTYDSGPKFEMPFFFSFKNLALSVTRYHMRQLSSSTLSGKTNNPILRKRSGRRTDERTGACYEIKKSVGRPFDTSRCCRKWFSISYTKRKLRNCEWPLKLLGKKINTYWESWFSRIGQNVQLSDVHDKYISFILYSIEMNCTFG